MTIIIYITLTYVDYNYLKYENRIIHIIITLMILGIIGGRNRGGMYSWAMKHIRELELVL